MTERLIARWSDTPYTSHRKRHITIRHQIVANWYSGVGCDLRHEVQCEERNIDEWKLAEKWEMRPHGVEKLLTEVGEELPIG